MSRLLVLLAVLSALVVATASPAAGDNNRSGAEPCQPFHTIQGPLGLETVTKADFISCERATRILKKHDGKVDPDVAFTKGGNFRLGDYRCGVRKVFTESARARCSIGDPMFRIDYGS